jgi:hypothetical protein
MSIVLDRSSATNHRYLVNHGIKCRTTVTTHEKCVRVYQICAMPQRADNTEQNSGITEYFYSPGMIE